MLDLNPVTTLTIRDIMPSNSKEPQCVDVENTEKGSLPASIHIK